MKYILEDNIALRTWKGFPYGMYVHGQRRAIAVSKEAYLQLFQCDGSVELPDNLILSNLLKCGYCKEAKQGETLSSWQQHRFCQNRYFPELNWAITGRCNYNCKHCFMAVDHAALTDEFTFEQCMTMLDELERCGIQNIYLNGGEPMLHPNFMEIVRECHKRRITIQSILTNASMLTKEMLEEFTEMVISPKFYISFDGIGHHDWLRGVNGSEKKVLSAIKLCHEMGFQVKVQMNIHRGNLDTMMPTIRMMDAIGVEEMRVIRTTESPRWAQNAGDMCLSIEEYFEVGIQIAKQYAKENLKTSLTVWQFINIYGKSKTYELVPVKANHDTYCDSTPICKVNRRLVSVAPNGDLVPCTQMSGAMKYHGVHLGNVHQQSLQSLLYDSDYLKAVTATVGEFAVQNETCGSCKWWKYCTGGCRACAWALTGEQNGHDPSKCIFFNDGYTKRLQAVFEPYKFHCLNEF
ncbi:MAG: radical SAM protein [Lachnospiraceae bacterium]